MDMMYICGGETNKLVKIMKGINDIEKYFDNKVMAGSSAGVYVLSNYYWDNVSNKVESGIGVLGMKTVCHWDGG